MAVTKIVKQHTRFVQEIDALAKGEGDRLKADMKALLKRAAKLSAGDPVKFVQMLTQGKAQVVQRMIAQGNAARGKAMAAGTSFMVEKMRAIGRERV